MRRGKFVNINDDKAITDIINMWEMDKTGQLRMDYDRKQESTSSATHHYMGKNGARKDYNNWDGTEASK